MNPIVLKMTHVSKYFGGVAALRDVHFELHRGEVHALMGENGAGKSTLMKILAGIHRPDSGTIEIDGQDVSIQSPHGAQSLGISIIHQELNLAPHLSVAENLWMGREPRTRWGLLDTVRLQQATVDALREVGATFSPSTPVGALSTGQQQLVEIAKSLSQNARILIMDEPTASLSEREAQTLFEIIHRLRERGIAIVYISHRMEEVYALSDRVTVLRDGQWVATNERANSTPETLIPQMVGRTLHDLYAHDAAPQDETVLEVRDLCGGWLPPNSFQVRRGEIVGLAGLIGAGRTELARLIFGADQPRSGEVLVEGNPVSIGEPRDAIRAGIALVPESRKEQGLFLRLGVGENIAMAGLPQLSRAGVLRKPQVRQTAQEYVENLGIRTASLEQSVSGLSGGNQQKVVLAKWLALRPKVLLLDEPTRGVDIGAKAEIYRIINQLAHDGVAIVMISSELPEVLGVSHRVLVMHEGRIVAELPATTSPEEVMRYATGVTPTQFLSGAIE